MGTLLRFQRSVLPCRRCISARNISVGSQPRAKNANPGLTFNFVCGDLNLKLGQKIKGYIIHQAVPMKELSLMAVMLEHEQTGAQHLHIHRDDDNNVFGVAFRTPPRDNTGICHILEHTTLCGSEKYPVRDPFFKMLNRSLSTFMNAFTASDWTMYPYSTLNAQDYKNLLSVYLDSAFFPRLREQDFRQEGWRLEQEDLKDVNSPMIFKGVVYNEMKGVYSDSQNLFHRRHQNLLLPSHTYGVDSGGDPANITDLTWQQLRDFHANYYHPSNARFFTYGNLPLDQHLEQIDEQVLSKFEKRDPDSTVPLELRWTEPQEHEMTCRPDPMAADPDKQTTVTVSWMLTDLKIPNSYYTSFTWSLMGQLLIGSEKSPFYRALIAANIGSDYSPVTGYSADTRQTWFSVGLQGIHNDDVDKVKAIIADTLDKVILEGFEQELIDALLHRIELSQKHQTSNFGLNCLMGSISSWNHDASPIRPLQVQACVDNFTKNMKEDPKYLQERLFDDLMDNQHRLTLVMRPDEKHESRLQEEEVTRLAGHVGSLDQAQKQQLHQQGVELAAAQDLEEDLSCLPTLRVHDIPHRLAEVETKIEISANTHIQMSEQPTCGVSYFRAIADTSSVPADLKPYLPLFCYVVSKMGAGTMDYMDLSQQIDLHTGGLNASVHIADHPTQPLSHEEGVVFSSYALDKNIGKMFELWSQIFHNLDVSDVERLQTLIFMSASEIQNSIVGSGHMYAMTHATSHLSASAQLRETMSGLTQAALMKSLAESGDTQAVTQKLKALAKHILSPGNLRCALNATKETMPKLRSSTEAFVADLNVASDANTFRPAADFTPIQQHTHYELPFQVNYACRSIQTVPYTHSDYASLRVLARLLTNKYLHKEIREKGGAYGGGASVSLSNPQFLNFYSYRDPQSMATLKAFDGAVSWALQGTFTQQHIDEAKLAIFAQTDAPVPAGDRGMRLFLSGINETMRDIHRKQLRDVTSKNLVQAASKYLSEENRVSAVTLLGPENPATKDNATWTRITV